MLGGVECGRSAAGDRFNKGTGGATTKINCSLKPVYYLAYHPTDVALYSDFCRFFHLYLAEAPQYLIVAAHPYFKYFECSALFGLFDQVTYLPDAGYSLRPRILFENVRYKRYVELLTFPDNVLVVTHALTHTELTINLLLRHIRRTARQARIVTVDVGAFYETMPALNQTNYWRARVRYASAVALLGAYPMVGQFRARRLVHQVYAREKQIIDQYLVLSDHFKNCPEYVTIKHPANLTTTSLDVDDGKETISSHPGYVFFFGNQRIPEFYPEVDQTTLIDLVNAVLTRLTELYTPTGAQLFYKPHPLEIGQPNLFNMKGFQLFDEPYSAEMLYTLYKNRILAVYSVASTSATTASLYGIRSFVFFEMLPFSPSTRAVFQRCLLDTNQVVSVHSLDELKAEEPHPRPVFNDHDAAHLLEALYGK